MHIGGEIILQITKTRANILEVSKGQSIGYQTKFVCERGKSPSQPILRSYEVNFYWDCSSNDLFQRGAHHEDYITIVLNVQACTRALSAYQALIFHHEYKALYTSNHFLPNFQVRI